MIGSRDKFLGAERRGGAADSRILKRIDLIDGVMRYDWNEH